MNPTLMIVLEAIQRTRTKLAASLELGGADPLRSEIAMGVYLILDLLAADIEIAAATQTRNMLDELIDGEVSR